MKYILALLLLGFLLLSRVPVSQAAEAMDAIPSLESSSQNHFNLGVEDISTEKVSEFVQAYLQVLDLVEQREGELQAAETQLESLRVQQEIETEAFAIIEAAGLTRQEYIQLLGLANTDPEFGERVAAQLQEATGKDL